MKIMFLSLSKTFKMEKDVIKIDIKENFNFFYKNYSNFNHLIKKVEEAKRVYKKEEKDLVSLKNDLYNKKGGSEINEQNISNNINMDKTTKELIFEIKRKEEENTRHAEKMKEYIKAKKENKKMKKIYRFKRSNSAVY